jgi:WD40 repeat protein
VWSEDGSEHQLTIEDSGFGAITGSPDGRLAASVGSEDGEIHLVDLETGAEVANFETPEHLSHLRTGLAFSPDGKRLVAVSEILENNTAELVTRNLSSASLISAACGAAGQELTALTWKAFVGTSPPTDLACH